MTTKATGWHWSRIFVQALVGAAVASLAQTSVAAVGRTATSAGVSPLGQATYSIPIVAPPGSAQLAPKLAFSYGHLNTQTLNGVGWSIAGLSTIARCGKTKAQDGLTVGVLLTNEDRFCLDGNQLKLFSGTYGANASEYRTEIETYARIRAFDNGGAGYVPSVGPQWFEVYAKDGLIYEYGGTENSRVQVLSTTIPRQWALSKVRDRSGNYIAFTYSVDVSNGAYRIAKVEWTGNAALGVSPMYDITFVYQSKPAGEIDAGYYEGSSVKEINRLQRVDVTYHESATSLLIRRYNLNYESTLSSTGKSRLANIEECAGATGTECLAPTTFSYQNGTNGVAGEIASSNSIATAANALSIDVNGDGKRDLVYSSSATSGAGNWLIAYGTSGGGFAAPLDTGRNNSNFSQAIPIDYDADGRDDILVPYSGGTWWVLLGQAGQNGLGSQINTGIPADGAGGNAITHDVNGDGLDDLVWMNPLEVSVKWRARDLNTTFGAPQDWWGPTQGFVALHDLAEGWVYQSDSAPDFDGDGRGDILIALQFFEYGTIDFEFSLVGGGDLFFTGYIVGDNRRYLDLNGDGYTDMAYTAGGNWYYRFSTGVTFGPELTGPAVGAQQLSSATVIDWDSDGYDDLAVLSGGTWHYMRSTGEILSAPVNSGQGASVAAAFAGDANGDGLDDLIYVRSDNTLAVRLHAGVAPDQMETATDGYGNVATFAYVSTAQDGYTKDAAAFYPEQDIQPVLQVVRVFTESDGTGGSYTRSHWYYGARVDLWGRGFQGFRAQYSWDTRLGFARVDFYLRSFPHTGQRYATQLTHADTTWIADTEGTPDHHVAGGGSEKRYYPYFSESLTKQYEFGGALNGALISTTHVQNTVASGSGTLTDKVVTTTEASSGNGVQAGAVYVQREYISSVFDDTTNWCIGRPGAQQAIGNHNQYGGAAITRTENVTWSGLYCRPAEVTAEPNNSTLQVVTELGYDSFGNVSSQTVTGVGMAARNTAITFDSKGRFPESITNALNETTARTWDGALATVSRETDPNGIYVDWYYDSFGRMVREDRPDGTATIWDRYACSAPSYCGVNWLRGYVYTSYLNTSNALVRQELRFTDVFDRLTHEYAQGLSGEWSYTYRGFDSLGRVSYQYMPYKGSASVYPYQLFSYDVLGRQTQIARTISDTNSALQTTYLYPEGLTTRTIDPLGKQTTKVTNVAGQVARSIDHAGYYQSFDVDGFGNAVRVSDSAGNTLQSANFNIRGMRTQSIDMDMGTWSYVPNALGEVTSQTDAKNQTVGFAFDGLGRLISRAEAEGTSTWTWGNSAGAKNIGRLQAVSGLGYSESFTFDGIGRPASRVVNADTAYQFDYSYNNFGAIDTLTYPTSTSGYRLKLQYEYSAGTLNRIKDFNAPSIIYWTANAANARGQVTQESLGNGLVTSRSIDAATGWVKSIQTGPSGGTSVQNLAYLWDKVGNLTKREDLNQSLSETFVYDNLYRLDYSQLNGATNLDLSYDALGNITNKSDVGSYTYHPTKRHAVVGTSGSSNWSFQYDANGNMTTGRGQNISWTSFNLPASITLPGSGGGGMLPTSVNWTGLVSATTGSNGAITKSAGNWYGGGRSTQTIDASGGAVEFKVSHTSNPIGSSSMIVTLHTLENDLTIASGLGYNWNIAQGWAHAHYNSQWLNGVAVTTGDTLKIAVENGQVKFYKNGTVVPTTTAAPSFPLHAYFYSYHNGYGLTQATMSSGSGGGGSTNLALHQPATGSTSCNANETHAKAVNGSISGGWTDKWCSTAATKWLQVNLGSTQSIGQFVVKHADAGGEGAAMNTKDFNIQVSADGNNWTTVATVTGNTQAITTHNVSTSGQYIRLNVITPTQTTDPAARIYEFEAYGSSGGGGGGSGALSAQFEYDANHQYIKQVGCYANGCSTTYYIGGMLEKVTTSGVVQYRHMIRTGGSAAIVSRASNGTSTTHYVTQDHLGSSSAVTSDSGAVLVNSSFGAFGARRGSNWQGTPSSADWSAIAATTRRGYTDHTMLDNLSLIHMNGRVMDPLLGRFIGADPYIDGEMHTQGWNRYAYARNNSLTFVDPTGHGLMRSYVVCEDAACPGVVQFAYGARVNVYTLADGTEEVLIGGSTPDYYLLPGVPDFDNPYSMPRLNVFSGASSGGDSPQDGAEDESPQRGCSVAGSATRAYANAVPSRLLGPVAFDSASEMSLLKQYFRGDTSPYRLNNSEMAQARSYVGTYGASVLGSSTTTRPDGLTERSVFFGRQAAAAPLLDGLLGTATGILSGNELVGIRDTFNFDFKDRGGYPYGTMANAGVALVRLDAATCAGDVSIPVSGGTQ